MNRLQSYCLAPVSIAPLAMFRVLFGFMMLISILRFIVKGWVYELYVAPKYFFSYYGFDWVKPLGETGMYLIFAIMALTTIGIMLGYKYRLSSVLFFLLFTYVELLDKTNYLNHYYFVSLVSFVMIWLPANRAFSLDARLNPSIELSKVPRGLVGIIRLQLGLVYFFAGVAKLNPDWLLLAEPLKSWLPVHTNKPVIGFLFGYEWMAYAMSWMGALFDLTVAFFMVWRPSRPYAYAAIIFFHLLTAWLFPIGMFPFIMIVSTLVFFPSVWHERIITRLSKTSNAANTSSSLSIPTWGQWLMVSFVVIQLALPFRYIFYPGNMLWTEQGFRFSWRVMLIEKGGHATFYVTDPATGKNGIADIKQYLTPNQEKMMSTQPDMILQFAHFLAEQYKSQGITSPEIRADVYVAFNGRGSQQLVDPTINLAQEKRGFHHKDWILSPSE